MRILVRTSRLAIWGRRLALFGFAVLLVSTGLHMFGQIASPVFEIALVIGTAIGALAFALGVAAYVTLWVSGDKGWGPASVGVFLGLVCLGPALAALAFARLYPSSADVTTAVDDPPRLVMAAPDAPQIDPESILQSFPNLITRIYQIPPEALFVLAQDLLRANGWTVLGIAEPSQVDNRVTVNALRRSLLGWENEIAFRVAASPMGAQIDLRSASLGPVYHDLGDNGRAIEAFLLALDDRVNAYIRDNLAMADDEPIAVPGSSGEEPQAQ
ncbi:DUF1499 domain-containing protein [Pelagibacterium lacus]|uniref:DUF1499 domain-containing protein n=1 Tax=Pelagibacterium lacus TaxID=2282655 RepID=A0A369W997_9HYPH|nr:DUF1499 domain-containing protein [Pelagibacterium lacus]RDE10549.1 DUF1499 domain-containing protein [Pelagibacterium lacus]